MEVLYLTTERMVDPILTIQQLMAVPFVKPPQVSMSIRRVFIAVSTLVSDKHGEDTQGEGRLLLFSLDYKRFDNKDAINATTMNPSDNINNINEITSNDNNGTKQIIEITNINTLFPMLAPGMPSALSNAVESSAQSQFFNSIQPKLKVHWQGPGPASVVKQMGQYVISTVGYCVYIYKLNKMTLEMDQVSFHYAQVCYSVV